MLLGQWNAEITIERLICKVYNFLSDLYKTQQVSVKTWMIWKVDRYQSHWFWHYKTLQRTIMYILLSLFSIPDHKSNKEEMREVARFEIGIHIHWKWYKCFTPHHGTTVLTSILYSSQYTNSKREIILPSLNVKGIIMVTEYIKLYPTTATIHLINAAIILLIVIHQ